MRQPGRRQSEAQVPGRGRFGCAFLMRQVMEQHDDSARMPLGAEQRRHLGPHRQLARPNSQHSLRIAKVLTADQTGADHPAEPIVLPNQVRHGRGIHLRHAEHRLGLRIDDLGFHRRGKDEDRVGQAIYNVAPEVQLNRWVRGIPPVSSAKVT